MILALALGAYQMGTMVEAAAECLLMGGVRFGGGTGPFSTGYSGVIILELI